jgi:hypothetical protein
LVAFFIGRNRVDGKLSETGGFTSGSRVDFNAQSGAGPRGERRSRLPGRGRPSPVADNRAFAPPQTVPNSMVMRLWSGIVLASVLCVPAQGQVFKRGERKSLLDSDPDVLECGTRVPLWMTPA